MGRLAAGSPAHERLREWVAEQGVGGLIVSVGPPLEVAAKLNMLQELADVPLLVAADVERGPGQRLAGGTVLPWGLDLGGGTDFPPIMALGAAAMSRWRTRSVGSPPSRRAPSAFTWRTRRSWT